MSTVGANAIRLEQDGLLFEGSVSSKAYPVAAGGSGGSGGVRDIRWNVSSGVVQVTFDGVTWLDRVEFEMFDA